MNNDGLIGYYSFDFDTDGIAVYDRSGFNQHGTIQTPDGDEWVSGKIGGGLELDGSSDYVLLNSADLSGTFTGLTVCGWMYLDTLGTTDADDGAMITKATNGAGVDGFHLWFNYTAVSAGDQVYSFSAGEAADVDHRVNGATKATAGAWQHVCGVMEGADRRLYLDGALDNTVSTGETSFSPSGSAAPRIGGWQVTSNFLHDGKLDEIRIYDRALSDSEIKRLYNFSAPKFAKTPALITGGLAAHWTFDGSEMSGTSAFDVTGQSNTGTLTNGPVRSIGAVGQALDFDGSNDFINVGDIDYISTGISDEYAVSLWIKFDIIKQTFFFGDEVNANGGVMMAINAGGNIETFIAGFRTSSYQVSANRWYHITQVQNSGGIDLYVDGVFIQRLTTLKHNETADNTNIGRFPGGGRHADGIIDDVRVFNRALSADEIQRLYNATRPSSFNISLSPGSLGDGLVGHWTMDGGDVSGLATFDISGAGHNGNSSSTIPRALGSLGQSLDFNGTSHFLNLADPDDYKFTSDLTIAAWVNPDRISGVGAECCQAIVNKTGFNGARSYSFITNGGASTFAFQVAPTASSVAIRNSSVAPVIGQWQHVVGVYDASLQTLNMYVDGVLRNGTLNGTVPASQFSDNGLPIFIGNRFGFAQQSFDGRIDDVRFYNRALSADEIKRLYNLGL